MILHKKILVGLCLIVVASCGPKRYGCGPRRCEMKTIEQPSVPQTLEKNRTSLS
jgi:hypothetical protein